MRLFRCLSLCGLFAFLMSGCLEQYDPSYTKALLQKEHDNATAPQPKLADDGNLPSGGGGKAFDVAGAYNTYCSNCHGAAGDGNGPGGAALTPKPRNFTDAAWQGQATDDRIAQVIKNGGASVGLSPMMAPWGSVMSDDEIKQMVAKVRSFKK